MISPSPQSVGQEFVRQYYTMLHTAPDFMHRFYSHDSSFIHGGHGDVSVYGQTNIHKKIISLNFRDCHARIRQVDSLGTVDNAVVVQVSGELSNAGLPMRKFMQTFVLAPQSPKKYYVHNDIFRYQDEVFMDDSTIPQMTTLLADSQENFDSNLISSINHPAVMQRTQGHLTSDETKPPSSSPPSTSPPPATSSSPPPATSSSSPPPTSSSLPKREEVQTVMTPPSYLISSSEVKVNQKKVDQANKKIEGRNAIKNETTNGGTLVGKAVVINHGGKDNVEAKKIKSVQTTPSSHTKTAVSWAAITKRPLTIIMEDKGGDIEKVKIQTRNETVVVSEINVDVNTSDQESNNKKQTEQKSPVDTKPQSNTTFGDDLKSSRPNAEAKNQLWSSEPSQQQQQQHNDSFQLFVGNLPSNITAVILRDIFSKFGEVFDVRINRKVSANRDVPNFGFVSFDSMKTIRKVLGARPFYLENGHRLNVEEKKSDQVRFSGGNAGGQQRNRTMHSFGSSRGWWGGYREGRKGYERFGGQKVIGKVRQE